MTIEKDSSGNFVYSDKILPGDVITRSFRITNTLDVPYHLTLFHKNEKSNPKEVLEYMEIEVVYKDKTLYRGNLFQDKQAFGNSVETGLDLGYIHVEDVSLLTIHYYFPGDKFTNEFQKANASFDWVLYATQTPEKTPDKVPDKTPEKTPDKAGTISTGDDVNIEEIWIVLIISGVIIICGTILRVKKKYAYE
ncbi:hypothetical protein M2475_001154 [Breznakia sp. PF5-3]|uniref:hypothetical protein n=1 Tax=unclassified Breznakia TaxID=2623764 RepID=UPI002404B465|nr:MULTISPECIES: hypothetical protein [unclassified Breznakia]MDF9824915.1 hypothetical protein [Breznakia sp. PM6-1]MDF9835586.1 hypothetical protein [Breznakia sp. PF5-3]MDF9837998.1 hypothetical protein [Breznakia sp. PFB2-8]MDF9859987.1 hypothetical protein [Breznakia sp. PH5-24]